MPGARQGGGESMSAFAEYADKQEEIKRLYREATIELYQICIAKLKNGNAKLRRRIAELEKEREVQK